MTAWGAYLIYGLNRKLNTPKAEVSFGLMMSVLNVLEGWSFYQPSCLVGLKTLSLLTLDCEDSTGWRGGSNQEKDASAQRPSLLVFVTHRFSIYTLEPVSSWSMLLHFDLRDKTGVWDPC